MDSIADGSPRQLARIAGGLYLINILGGAYAITVVPAMLVVQGDPAATAQNIQAHELLYRSGLAAHLVVTTTNVPLAVIFYELFKVVNRRLALLDACFILVATAIEAAGLLNQFAPLVLLGNGPYGRPCRGRGRGAPGRGPGDGGGRSRPPALVTLCVGAATLGHLLADCWQTTLRAGVGDAKCLVELRGFEPLTPCMPCSFALLHYPRSAMCAQFNDPLRVTVVIRWIPLVTAPSGTRMARRAVRGRLSSRYPCLGWRGSSTTRWQELVAQMMAPLASIGGSASMKAPSTTSCQAT
jgi:Domain of unknown function (DUF4386)